MKSFWLAVPMSLLLAAPAEAVRPTYSYFEASYLDSKADAPSSDAQGPRVGLNISLARAVYFTGGFEQLDFDGSATKRNLTSLGFGAHSLKSTFQFFVAGTYERRHINRASSAFDSTDEGYGLQLGVRVPIAMFELQGDYKYFNFGDLPNGKSDDDTRYRATVLGHLTPGIALTASYETFDQSEAEQWTAGFRFYFKTRYDVPPKKRRRAAASAPADSGAPSGNQEADSQ